MMSSNKNSFSASDIERYHSGQMSAQERHALEKAALDDPFLADALEGYAFTSTPQQDLAKIAARLSEKKDGKRVVPFFKTYRWLSAAAVFIILAGAGWLVYTNSSNENQSLAKKNQPVDNNKPSQETTDPVTVQIPFDTDTASNLNSVAATSPKKDLKKTQTQFGYKSNDNVTFKETKPVETDEGITLQNTAPVTVFSDSSITSNAVTNVTRNAQWQNNVANNRSSSAPTLNDSRPFFNERRDSNTKDVNPLAGRTNGITSDTIKNLDVVLKRQPLDDADVVVMKPTAKSKSADKYPRVIIDTLEPTGGYVKFDDYVANNLQMPEEFLTKQTSGEVQLSFEVDKDGKPINITVVKSLCEKCDEEAIRLLKEGPKWKKKKNKKGKITIKF